MLAHLTNSPQRPTALFCSNDLLAMVVMRGLCRAHIRVPQDMSILGFDGLAVGELLAPPLATISTPNRDIGRSAWQRLMARIGGGDNNAGASLGLTLLHTVREGGTIASAVPSPAHQATLDLADDAPSTFTLEPPAYALHRYDPRGGVVTHHAYFDESEGPYPFHEPTGDLIP